MPYASDSGSYINGHADERYMGELETESRLTYKTIEDDFIALFEPAKLNSVNYSQRVKAGNFIFEDDIDRYNKRQKK